MIKDSSLKKKLLHQLYNDQIYSDCCKSKLILKFGSPIEESYYICRKCSNPCQTIGEHEIVQP